MKYQWAEGFHPPKGVTADQVKAVIDRLQEPTPEALLHASKAKKHVLHGEFWSEGDQVWAQRGRVERARRILGAVQEVVVVGGRELQVRSVEFLRPEGEGRWIRIEDVLSDPMLLDAYLHEVQRLQDQASAKMHKLRAMMHEAKEAA